MKIPNSVKRVIENRIAAFVLCLAFTLLMLNHRVLPLNVLPYYDGSAGQDCYQMVWDLWEVNESITSGHNPYRTGLIYYPLGAELGRHSLAAGFFPLTFIVKVLTRGDLMYPVYAYRVAILLSFTLILYFTYLALRELGFDSWAAIIPAIAYAFSAFYTEHFFHLTQVAGFFIPLTAFLFIRWYKQPGFARFLAAVVIGSCSLYFTEFAIYILMGAILTVICMLIVARERNLLADNFRRTGTMQSIIAGVAGLLIATPFVMSFLMARTLNPAATESSYYSANLAGFILPLPQDAPLYGNIFLRLTSGIETGFGEPFIGFAALFLVVVALAKSKSKVVCISVLISVFFFILSLGPALKILRVETHVPLPYALLMHMPPFDAGRTPVRFVAVGMFFLMIVAASGMTWLQGKLDSSKSRWGVLALSLILAWTIAEKYSPIPRAQSFAPPGGLEKIVSGPVLNLPLIRNDGYAEALQVFHRQPIGTGYLARYTTGQRRHFDELQRLFNKGGATFCAGVKSKGFSNIVIAPRQVVSYPLVLAPLELSKCSLNIVDLRTGTLYAPGDGDDAEIPDQFPLYTLGARIDLTSQVSDQYLWYGWSDRETQFRWTNRNRAAVVFSIGGVEPAILRIKLGAFLVAGQVPRQRVNVALNGHQLAQFEIRHEDLKEYSITLPIEFLRMGNVLTFDLPDAESPAAIHLSEDERVLGIKVQWIEIDAAK